VTWERRRTVAVAGFLVVLLVGSLLLTGPPADETLALRRFLREMDVDVSASSTPPSPPGTFVLLADLRDREQAASLVSWVYSGGDLVVADPNSVVLELLHVRRGEPLGLVGTTTVAPSCPTPEVVGVDRVVIDAGDVTLVPSGPEAISCFARPGGAFAIFLSRGAGRVALLGGRSPLTNDYLDKGDNAVFATRLFRREGRVVFGPAAAPITQPPGLWELLPGPARLILLEVALAGMLFAFARGRRLGKPVIEEPIAPIPSGELVRATAGLYREARDVAYAGRLLRRSAIERVSRSLGTRPDSPSSQLVEMVTTSTGLPSERVERALVGPEPSSEGELLALGDELTAVVRHLERLDR
jgi:hypothetical protein